MMDDIIGFNLKDIRMIERHYVSDENNLSWTDFLIRGVVLGRVVFGPSCPDLDLHCLQRQGISGFSRTRVKQVSLARNLTLIFICLFRLVYPINYGNECFLSIVLKTQCLNMYGYIQVSISVICYIR